jgi:hypothetical protein
MELRMEKALFLELRFDCIYGFNQPASQPIDVLIDISDPPIEASLAQSVERETLNLKVAGSTPAWGFLFCIQEPEGPDLSFLRC